MSEALATMSIETPQLEVVKQDLIWVRPNSNVQGVAALLTNSIDENKRITLRAIGAGAVNQAVKGSILSRQQLAAQGFDMVLRPGFANVEGNDGGQVTAVVLHCLLA